MKKQKKVLTVVTCMVFAIALLTGCGKTYTSISDDEFEAKMAALEYNITYDDSYDDNEAIESVALAYPDDMSYQIEFWTFSTDDICNAFFSENKDDMEAKKGSASVSSGVDMTQHGYYSLTTASGFYYISRINNTCVYVSTDKQYKDDIQSALESIGY
jgi:hypothetical protein